MYRVGLLDYVERRLLRTRQRDRGYLYIYMRLSQRSGTLFLPSNQMLSMWRLSFSLCYMLLTDSSVWIWHLTYLAALDGAVHWIGSTISPIVLELPLGC